MRKSELGLIVIATLWLISISLWISSKIYFNEQIDLDFWNIYVGQFLAISGATLLTVNVYLATRLRFIEYLFGGLDRLFKVHIWNGKIAYTLLFFHPVSFILTDLFNWEFIKVYIIPGFVYEQTWGILALYSLTLIIIFTVFNIIPYDKWRFLHKCMGVPLLFAAYHVYVIPSDVAIFTPLRVWMLGLFTLAIIAYFYREFYYPFFGPRYKYQVEKINPVGNVTEIYMKPLGKPIEFKPGQFAFWSFKSNHVSTEPHPFSFSNAHENGLLRVSAKKSGDFTSKLDQLQPGDTVNVYGPYGMFNPTFMKPEYDKQIWIAGGIGVTPFLSMSSSQQYFNNNIIFYFTFKEAYEETFGTYIDDLTNGFDSVTFHKHPSEKMGYLTAKDISKDVGDLSNTLIMICGPIVMMKTLEKDLIALGAQKKNIIYEEFKLR